MDKSMHKRLPHSTLSINHSMHERNQRAKGSNWHQGHLSVDAKKNRGMPGPVAKNKLFLNSKIQTQTKF